MLAAFSHEVFFSEIHEFFDDILIYLEMIYDYMRAISHFFGFCTTYDLNLQPFKRIKFATIIGWVEGLYLLVEYL